MLCMLQNQLLKLHEDMGVDIHWFSIAFSGTQAQPAGTFTLQQFLICELLNNLMREKEHLTV